MNALPDGDYPAAGFTIFVENENYGILIDTHGDCARGPAVRLRAA